MATAISAFTARTGNSGMCTQIYHSCRKRGSEWSAVGTYREYFPFSRAFSYGFEKHETRFCALKIVKTSNDNNRDRIGHSSYKKNVSFSSISHTFVNTFSHSWHVNNKCFSVELGKSLGNVIFKIDG